MIVLSDDLREILIIRFHRLEAAKALSSSPARWICLCGSPTNAHRRGKERVPLFRRFWAGEPTWSTGLCPASGKFREKLEGWLDLVANHVAANVRLRLIETVPGCLLIEPMRVPLEVANARN